MTTSAHPSPEGLGAYFDKELSPSQSTEIDTHLSQCAECRTHLEWFGLLSEMGPRIEESLPGDGYWTDLPSRVLQRLLLEEAVPQTPVASDPPKGFWNWLWRPNPRWRVAMGGVAGMAVAGVVWLAVQRTPNPWVPTVQDAAVPTESALSAALPLPEELQPRTSPQSQSAAGFAQRVFLTYGGRDNMGTSLDLGPGDVVPDQGGSSVGTQVTQRGLLNQHMRAIADEVVRYGCGEDSLELAWLASLRAEQEGDYRTAALGYQLLMNRVGPEHPLFAYVDYRLNYLVWKVRMERGQSHQGKTLAELNRIADRYYETWEQSGRNVDCRKAWCMNRVLQQIGPELQAAAPIQQTSSRIEQLEDCLQ